MMGTFFTGWLFPVFFYFKKNGVYDSVYINLNIEFEIDVHIYVFL